MLFVSLVSCSSDPRPEESGDSAPPPAPNTPPTVHALPAVSAQINQFRDNYAKRIIEIQLTNNTAETVTVLDATLQSDLFGSAIIWSDPIGGIELPPRQTKSLPAQLPEATCNNAVEPTGAPTGVTAGKLTLRITTQPAVPGQASLEPTDPHGVLSRNNTEQCISKAADAIAEFRVLPVLEVAADGATAVVRIRVLPRPSPHPGTDGTPGVGEPGNGQTSLTIERIDGTTLIAEEPTQPWPRGVEVSAGGPPSELRLVIRPARCDPHAVAEDKVGTLFPLRIIIAGQQGVLKIDAGEELKGRIHDFVTATCHAHQDL
jgi:hypothetical protein